MKTHALIDLDAAMSPTTASNLYKVLCGYAYLGTVRAASLEDAEATADQKFGGNGARLSVSRV